MALIIDGNARDECGILRWHVDVFIRQVGHPYFQGPETFVSCGLFALIIDG